MLVVVVVRERAGEPETRQVEAYHPARQDERLCPPIPGVQTGGCSVAQDDGRRVIAQPLIPHMHLHSRDFDERRWRWCPATTQFGHAAVWCPVCRHKTGQRQDDEHGSADTTCPADIRRGLDVSCRCRNPGASHGPPKRTPARTGRNKQNGRRQTQPACQKLHGQSEGFFRWLTDNLSPGCKHGDAPSGVCERDFPVKCKRLLT